MNQSFRTNRFGTTVQTQIRLLLEEQSEQHLYCLPFHLHLFDEIHLAALFEFQVEFFKQSFLASENFRTLRYVSARVQRR